jgi:hypothetical protein
MFFGTSRVAQSPRILMSDLSKIGLLGAGGFGAVELWEHKSSGETYVPWREPGVDESYCTISRISFEYIYIFILLYINVYII